VCAPPRVPRRSRHDPKVSASIGWIEGGTQLFVKRLAATVLALLVELAPCCANALGAPPPSWA